MAYLTVNTQGTHPHVYLSMSTDTADLYDGTGSALWVSDENALDVTCLQDVTVNNSTGIFSWTDFCSEDMNKVTTPADNSISTNMVVDPTVFFGTVGSAGTNAIELGVNNMSAQKQYVQWVLVMDGELDGTVGKYWYRGLGYITSIAPTVSPDSPVWISPMEIAVTGDMTTGTVTS